MRERGDALDVGDGQRGHRSIIQGSGAHMDNVCHTLVGAALAETGLKHRTRYGAAALMIAANLPDVDVLVFATNTPSVAFRRGWTHGILAQLLLPVALAGAFWAWDRWRPGARSPEPEAAAVRSLPSVSGGWSASGIWASTPTSSSTT